MPYQYQDRAAQARAIERAYQWLERRAQLAHFESIVLRTSALARTGRRREADDRGRPQPPSGRSLP